MLNKISGSKVGVNLYDSWINPTVTWVNAHKECISLHNPSLLTLGQVSFFGLTGSHWLLGLLKAVNAWKDPFQRIIGPKNDNKASAEIFGNPLKRIQQRRKTISFWQKNLISIKQPIENWWQRNHYSDLTIWRCLLAQFVYSVVSAVFVFRSLPFRSNTGPLYRWEKSTDTESVPDWFLDPKNCNGFVVKDQRFNLLLCK